jgi:hypothetical protein
MHYNSILMIMQYCLLTVVCKLEASLFDYNKSLLRVCHTVTEGGR